MEVICYKERGAMIKGQGPPPHRALVFANYKAALFVQSRTLHEDDCVAGVDFGN